MPPTPPTLAYALTAAAQGSRELIALCEAPDYAYTLSLSNETGAPHAFKLKTNAPRRWVVRPSTGVVAAGEAVQVTVKVNRTSPLIGIEGDRQRILTAPISDTEAARLRSLRETNPREASPQLREDSPGVTRGSVTPQFAALPVPLAMPGSEAAVVAAAAPSSAAQVPELTARELPSPELAEFASPPSSGSMYLSALPSPRYSPQMNRSITEQPPLSPSQAVPSATLPPPSTSHQPVPSPQILAEVRHKSVALPR